MTEDLLKQLERLDPIDGERLCALVPPEEELAAIMRSARSPARPRTSRPTSRRPARLIAAIAVAAAAVVAITVRLPGGEIGAAPAAAEALESAAAVASAEATPSGSGRFTYYRLIQTTTGSAGGNSDRTAFAWTIPSTVEQWVAPDGSGRVRTIAGEPEFAEPTDETAWRHAGSPSLGPKPGTVTDRRAEPGELNGIPYEGQLPPVRGLPADADELLSIFREEHGESSASVPQEAKLFEYAASVLLSTGTRPELRAALFELVARIDGVEYDGQVRDPLGRTGTAVSMETDYSGAPERHTLIFDSKSSFPLAYMITPTAQPNHLVIEIQPRYTVLEASGAVPDTRTRP
jgi:hypothetical protein